MCKKKNRIIAAVGALICALGMTSCGVVELLDEEKETTATLFTTTTAAKSRESVHTTKTGVFDFGEIDDDDEDYSGYTTTTTLGTETLENDFSDPNEEIDYEMRATQKTEAKTFYTIPEHNGTTAPPVTVEGEQTTDVSQDTESVGETVTVLNKKTETTTTALKPDTLFSLQSEDRYSADKSYKVTSDTTYLNLRYGPSKKYNIILQIPDGSQIYGKGEVTGPDGNRWVYTSYNGGEGWVMRELLS